MTLLANITIDILSARLSDRENEKILINDVLDAFHHCHGWQLKEQQRTQFLSEAISLAAQLKGKRLKRVVNSLNKNNVHTPEVLCFEFLRHKMRWTKTQCVTKGHYTTLEKIKKRILH